jgi:serine/threonine-protein kinase
MSSDEGLKRSLAGGRYQLSTVIGRGASGTVWEAWDRPSNRLVAVKVFHASVLASSLGRKRFLREAELASTLRHPHCVEVLDHGEDDEGCAYLVMERLFGTTLAAHLRARQALPQLEAIELGAQMLDAIGAAHAVRIVHRDLKPANVILVAGEGGREVVKVCDFGLAKAIDFDTLSREHDGDEDVDLSCLSTEQGDICGTPEYMAPEQARGEVIDGRADLYSAAVILYHALVGRPPFQSRSPLAVVSMHLTAPPPRPSALRPDLQIYPPLENLILRALSKDRADRPSAATVFRADLLQIGRDYARRQRLGRDVTSVEAPTLAGAPRRRSRWRTSAIALGLTALVATGAIQAGRQLASHAARSGPAAAIAAPLPPAVAATPEQPPARFVAPPATSAPPAPPAPSATSAPPATPATSAPAAPPAPATDASTSRRVSRRARIDSPTRDAAPEPSLAAAEERLGAGKIGEACAIGQAVADAHPRAPAPWQFLGRCSMRLGDRARAVAAFERYLELAPGAADAPFVRAILEEAR